MDQVPIRSFIPHKTTAAGTGPGQNRKLGTQMEDPTTGQHQLPPRCKSIEIRLGSRATTTTQALWDGKWAVQAAPTTDTIF